MKDWKFKQAHAQSDIIWESINADKNYALLKTTILLILLFIFSVVLITPIWLAATAENVIKGWGWQSETFDSYIRTYITLFVNIVLIPFFIDVMVLIEDFDTRSDR